MMALSARWLLPGRIEEVLVADARAPARVREIADVIIGRGDPSALLRDHPGCLIAVGRSATGVLEIRDRSGREMTAAGALPPAVCGSLAHLMCSGLVVPGEVAQAGPYVVGLLGAGRFEKAERVLEFGACGGPVAEGLVCVGAEDVGVCFTDGGSFGACHLLCLVERGEGVAGMAGPDVGASQAER